MNMLLAVVVFLSVHSLVDPVVSACSIGSRQPVPGSNCTQFQLCHRNGSWSTPFDCGLSTLWNHDKQTCDFWENVDVVKCLDKAKQKKPEVPACSGSGQYVGWKRSRCRHFRPCGAFGSSADLVACQPGTLFEEKLQKCMPARAVDPETCELRPSEKCTPPAIRSILQCTTYQLCTREGTWSGSFRCPPGMRINIQTAECDFAENVLITNCLPIA